MSRRPLPGSRSGKGKSKYDSVPQDFEDEEAIDHVVNLRSRRRAADSESEGSLASDDETSKPERHTNNAAPVNDSADSTVENQEKRPAKASEQQFKSGDESAPEQPNEKPKKRGYLRNRGEQKWESHSLAVPESAQSQPEESGKGKEKSGQIHAHKENKKQGGKWEEKSIERRGNHNASKVSRDEIGHQKGASIDGDDGLDSRQDNVAEDEDGEHDKEDPTLIPRKQKYFMHDDRSKSGGRPPRRQNKEETWEPAEGGKWTHDKFAQDSQEKPKKERRNRRAKDSTDENHDAATANEFTKGAKPVAKQTLTKTKEPVQLVVTIVTKTPAPSSQETPVDTPQVAAQPATSISKKYSSRRAQGQTTEPELAQAEQYVPSSVKPETAQHVQHAHQEHQERQHQQQSQQPPFHQPQIKPQPEQPPQQQQYQSPKEFPHPRDQLRAGANALELIFPPTQNERFENTRFSAYNPQASFSGHQPPSVPFSQSRPVQDRRQPNAGYSYGQAENSRQYQEYPTDDVYQGNYAPNRPSNFMPSNPRANPESYDMYAWYPPSAYAQVPPNYYYYQNPQANAQSGPQEGYWHNTGAPAQVPAASSASRSRNILKILPANRGTNGSGYAPQNEGQS